MNNLRAALAALDLAIGGHATTRRQAVLHPGIEVEETHGEHAAAVADLTHQHAASAKRNIGLQHFALYRRPDAGQQIVNGVELSAVFVA